jgi:hypothetical protein
MAIMSSPQTSLRYCKLQEIAPQLRLHLSINLFHDQTEKEACLWLPILHSP